MTMWRARGSPDVCAMPPVATPANPQVSDAVFALRVHRGDDATELQRRLEACLLIVRRVAPALADSAS